MALLNTVLADDLKEILNLQVEIKIQENKYTSLLKADEPLETLKEIRVKLKYLNDKLKVKEKHAMTLLN